MEADKTLPIEEAIELVPDGATLYLGGAILDRKPVALVRALIAAGRRDLDVVTFAGSLDVDLLVGAGAVRSVSAAYVGLGVVGGAPRFIDAVTSGSVEDREFSEWTLLGRLRAAAMGVPFLPSRAAVGSDVLGLHDLRLVTDPYSDIEYLALPPLRPDVALLHAWRASGSGHIQMHWPPQHLWDVDVLAARASERVVVSVNSVVAEEVVWDSPERTRLFGLEVDAVVELPGGSWPTSSPPDTEEDVAVVLAYREAGGDPAVLDRGMVA